MVDWVMIFAWPFLKNLQIITTSGVVKKGSKVKRDRPLALPAARKMDVIDQVAEKTATFNELTTHM
jgi:hypothetical protein